MITVADLIKKTDAFVKANPGKINAKLTYNGKSGKSLSPLEKYCEIKKQYDSGSFIDPVTGRVSLGFKKLYMNFYRMNNRALTTGFIEKYFELLVDATKWGKGWSWQVKHEYIVDQLKTFLFPRKKGSMIEKYQCSFISKLLHTANNELPIYDSKVRNVIKCGQPKGKTYSDKVSSGIAILNDIEILYRDLAKDPTFITLMGTVTCFSGLSISFEKKCDFMFWIMG